MNPRVRVLVGAMLLLLVAGSVARSQRIKWVTAYYPKWAMMPLGTAPWGVPPWELDFTGITHIIHFHVGVDSKNPPYFKAITSSEDSIDIEFNGIANPGAGPSTWIPWQDSLITIAHRCRIRVLLSLDAVDPTDLNIVSADSSKLRELVNSMVAYCERKGYDGVEIDWEGEGIQRENVTRLIRMFRRRLDRSPSCSLLAIAASTWHWEMYDPSLDSLVDQYNLMMYDYVFAWGGPLLRRNLTWHLAPLHLGQVPIGFQGKSFDTRGPLQWLEAGHDPKKLGIGIPLFGYVLKDVSLLFDPIESAGSYGYAKYQECLRMAEIGGLEGWDDIRKVPFISGVADRDEGNPSWGQPGVRRGQKFFATFENPRSIRAKIAWTLEHGFGGIMIYDLTMDWDMTSNSGSRSPLLRATVEAVRELSR